MNAQTFNKNVRARSYVHARTLSINAHTLGRNVFARAYMSICAYAYTSILARTSMYLFVCARDSASIRARSYMIICACGGCYEFLYVVLTNNYICPSPSPLQLLMLFYGQCCSKIGFFS